MRASLSTVPILIGCLSVTPVVAQPADASVVEAIKHREHEWADAMTAVNVDKLNQIMADDFADGYPGHTTTKLAFIDDVKSGKHKLEGYEFGPIDVKVLGNVAVVQGTCTEQRMFDGHLNTVHVAFMDIFTKRGDKWVVVRGQGHKI